MSVAVIGYADFIGVVSFIAVFNIRDGYGSLSGTRYLRYVNGIVVLNGEIARELVARNIFGNRVAARGIE